MLSQISIRNGSACLNAFGATSACALRVRIRASLVTAIYFAIGSANALTERRTFGDLERRDQQIELRAPWPSHIPCLQRNQAEYVGNVLRQVVPNLPMAQRNEILGRLVPCNEGLQRREFDTPKPIDPNDWPLRQLPQPLPSPPPRKRGGLT